MPLSFDLPRNVILPVDVIDVRLDSEPHPFEHGNADAIARNWDMEVAANPALFDGTVVLLSALNWRDGILSGRCHAVRFSTFLYWRKNRDTPTAQHAFAHAVLVSGDNALVAVRMGGHTANAGRVYFAAGSFEPVDFHDGQVDVHFNMAREVGEETGIDLSTAERGARHHVLATESGTVIFRRYRLAQTADEIARSVEAFVAAETEPEIDGPVVIRNAQDLPEGVMPHMKALVEWHFSTANS
jgi:8-oxo-dGTP pyrophosphatase MutT (NUDIX family)